MKKNYKRIAALIGAALLLLIYVFTFVLAFMNFPGWEKLFRIGIAATILVPVMVWFYIWMIGKLTHKSTMADLFPEEKDPDSGSGQGTAKRTK